jgi:transposase
VKSITEFPAVYLCTGAADMRLGMDRLSAQIQSELSCSVFSGGLFVFVSRCRRKVKILYWDRDGYAMWLKRLEAGVFRIERKDGYEEITGVDLAELLSGMDYSRIKLRQSAAQGLYT